MNHPLNKHYSHVPTGAVVTLYAVELNPDVQQLHYEGVDARGCVFKGMLHHNLIPFNDEARCKACAARTALLHHDDHALVFAYPLLRNRACSGSNLL